MSALLTSASSEIPPYFAIAVFAGIRPNSSGRACALPLKMGNSVEVIMERYSKVLDEPEDAARFWAITPAEDAGKVVAFAEIKNQDCWIVTGYYENQA